MSVVATDTFVTASPGFDAPASHIVAITPSDSDDLMNTSRCILASAAVTAKITTVGGETVTGYPIQAGYNPIRVTRVWSNGTTLSGATLWNLY